MPPASSSPSSTSQLSFSSASVVHLLRSRLLFSLLSSSSSPLAALPDLCDDRARSLRREQKRGHAEKTKQSGRIAFLLEGKEGGGAGTVVKEKEVTERERLHPAQGKRGREREKLGSPGETGS